VRILKKVVKSDKASGDLPPNPTLQLDTACCCSILSVSST